VQGEGLQQRQGGQQGGEKRLDLNGGNYHSVDLVPRSICGPHGVHAQVRGGQSTIQSSILPKKYFYFFDLSTPFEFYS